MSKIKIVPLQNMLVLQFPILQQYPLIHGTFLRIGGVSKKPFNSLNFGLSTGDNIENVLNNHNKALKAFLKYPKKYVYLNQIHSNIIFKVNENNYESLKNKNGDGLITNEQNLTLMSFHADCQATIIYDPRQHIIANVHAGWRGQIEKNIYNKIINVFIHRYHSHPKDLIVCISPSLGPNYSKMRNIPEFLYKNFSKHIIHSHYFNFWSIAKEQFSSLGIPKKNVYISELCTFSNPQYFYSYRREQTTGRHATIITLLEK